MDAAGEGPDLSLELAGVFEGEIDFNSDLQVGDRFVVAFERVSREGRPPSYGDVLCRRVLERGPRPEGRPVHGARRQAGLLRRAGPVAEEVLPEVTAEVRRRRSSSNFSKARMHPVLRIVRPHLGIDYRAASGSPVVAVANGVVVSAGWNGDAGRMVHLRHASGYETFYMHLSSIAVRPGQRVGQGDLIGRVGTSGLSTGPAPRLPREAERQLHQPVAAAQDAPAGRADSGGVPGGLRRGARSSAGAAGAIRSDTSGTSLDSPAQVR